MLLESLVALTFFSQNPDTAKQEVQRVPWWPYYEIKTEEIKKEQKIVAPIPILCYHWVVPKEHKVLSTARRYAQTIEEFRTTIRNYKKKGYEFITVTELYDLMSNYDSTKVNKEDTSKYVLITVDDGLKCFYDYAYPVLLEEKVKATLFIVNSCIEDSNNKGPYLSWKNIKEMYASGLVDVQSHTYDSHVIKGYNKSAVTTKAANEDSLEYMLRIFADFLKSKQEIENRIGNKVIAIAWPFGLSNDVARRLAALAGYELFFTVNGENFKLGKTYKDIPRREAVFK